VRNEINVALAQLNPTLRDTAENVQTMRGVIAEHGDADLVVFPELFVSSYTVNGLDELALDLDGPEVRSVARAAQENGTTVIFGAPERVVTGVTNSAIYVDRRGEVVGSYRKIHLFGDERTAFVVGEESVIVDVDGLKVGLMICFDVEFPEVARSLAQAGADLLVTISANMEPFGRDHEVFSTARALENGVPHLYVNQVGIGEAFTFPGGTMAVSADGDRLVAAGLSEEVIRFDLDLLARNSSRPANLRPNYLKELRSPLPVVTLTGQSEGKTPRSSNRDRNS
jgi:predicted amidohydrolase